MTIPKTHPLYGAVEALAKEDFEKVRAASYSGLWRSWEDLAEENRQHWMKTHVSAICRFEAAGYRVVGPEPTEAMVEQAEEMYMPMGEMIATWYGFWHAAPTITETEKGK